MQTTLITNKVPWLLVLNKYLEQWKQENSGRIPSNYKEKTQLRETIRRGNYNNLCRDYLKSKFLHLAMTNDEENFEEAIKSVNTAFGGGKVTADLESIFEDEACTNLNKQVSFFYICL